MRKAVKEKWLNALRSGEYKQGKELLKTSEDSYCCLGVLCDIHRKTVKKAGYKWNQERQYLNNDIELPEEVQKWAGLVSKNPGATIKGNFITLAELNDGEGYGFKRIAQVIEKHL